MTEIQDLGRVLEGPCVQYSIEILYRRHRFFVALSNARVSILRRASTQASVTGYDLQAVTGGPSMRWLKNCLSVQTRPLFGLTSSSGACSMPCVDYVACSDILRHVRATLIQHPSTRAQHRPQIMPCYATRSQHHLPRLGNLAASPRQLSRGDSFGRRTHGGEEERPTASRLHVGTA